MFIVIIVVLVLALPCMLSSEYVQTSLIQYDQQIKLHGFQIATATVHSRIQCAILCVQNDICSSLQYNKNTGLCSTHVVGFEDSGQFHRELDQGNVLYSIKNKGGLYSECSRDADCRANGSICNNETCNCPPAYGFQTERNICLGQCPGNFSNRLLDNNIVLHVGISIRYRNTRIIYDNLTLQDCVRECIAETSFQCLSFDYHVSSWRCHLSKQGYFDVEGWEREETSSDWIFGARCCENPNKAMLVQQERPLYDGGIYSPERQYEQT